MKRLCKNEHSITITTGVIIMKIFLLRHGTPINGRKYRGNSIDDDLSDLGWSQMKASVNDKKFDIIYTSPMKRCRKFAKYLSKKIKVSFVVIEDFKEIGFGDWENKTSFEIGEDNVKTFKDDPLNYPIKNAENLYDFQSRVLSNYFKILSNSNTSSNILLVTHAGVIRVIKSHILKLPIENMFTIDVKSGSCEQFEI